MSFQLPPKCEQCLHLQGYGKNGLFCLAFPDGVPEEILSGAVEHDRVIEGQEGEYVYTHPLSILDEFNKR